MAFITRPELTASLPAGARDFDFLHGSWTVHNRVLRERLVGSADWEEWPATLDVVPILGGLGNVDRFRAERDGSYFEGVSLRLFDVARERWAIYWVDTRTGVLCPPVYGAFDGGRGTFEGDEVFRGRPVRVRFTWAAQGPERARWQQAYSADGGDGWEVNWVMDFTRR